MVFYPQKIIFLVVVLPSGKRRELIDVDGATVSCGRPASVDALDEVSDGTNTPLTGGSETGESAPDTTPGVISPPASTLRLLAKPPKKR